MITRTAIANRAGRPGVMNMADTRICPFCKAEGKAGIMELQRVHSFHGSDRLWKCTRCGKEIED